jgi:phosphatidylglycerophosphate synthase
MLDPLARRLIDPPLDRAGAWLARRRVSANLLTLAGLAIGLASMPLIAHGHDLAALAVIVINRLLDGLDGAVARHSGPTSFGGYLDIVCDMAFYAAVPLGFAFAHPDNGVPASLLLASFVCTSASFLGRAIVAAQRNQPDLGLRGRKSFFHSAGLIEGTETILAFTAFCLFPSAFPWLAATVAVLCFWTAGARVVEGYRWEKDWTSNRSETQ